MNRKLAKRLSGLGLLAMVVIASGSEAAAGDLEEELKRFLINRQPSAEEAMSERVVSIEFPCDGQGHSNLYGLPAVTAAGFLNHLFARYDLQNVMVFSECYIKAAPDVPTPYFYLGRALELQGKVTEALAQYMQASKARKYFFPDFRLWGIHRFVNHDSDMAEVAWEGFEKKLKLYDGVGTPEQLRRLVADQQGQDAMYFDSRGDSSNAIRMLQMLSALFPLDRQAEMLLLIRPRLTNAAVLQWLDDTISKRSNP